MGIPLVLTELATPFPELTSLTGATDLILPDEKLASLSFLIDSLICAEPLRDGDVTPPLLNKRVNPVTVPPETPALPGFARATPSRLPTLLPVYDNTVEVTT